MATDPIQPLTDEEKAQLAELTARQTAAEAAEKAAAADAMRTLVVGDAFRAARTAMVSALVTNPLEADLVYAVTCMDRLTDRYAAA